MELVLSLLCVHADTVIVHRSQDFLRQDLNRRVVWQRELEETCRCCGQTVILVHFVASSVLTLVLLNLELDVGSGICGIIWWQSLLAPAENDELFAILIGNVIVEELPEVLDKRAIFGILRLILWILCMAS